jgi:hypothetical protein
MPQNVRKFHDNRGGRMLLIGVNELTFSMYRGTKLYFEVHERRRNTCTTSRSRPLTGLISADILFLFP